MATQTLRSNVSANRQKGKVAIITGGDQGIGRAIAFRLAAEGANIAICYRANRSGAEEVIARITADAERAGTKRSVLALQAAVSNTAEIRNFVTDAFERLGTADILVNNAAGKHSPTAAGDSRRRGRGDHVPGLDRRGLQARRCS